MHEQGNNPDDILSESADKPKGSWVAKGFGWLGKCTGLAAGYSVHAARKTRSAFTTVGRFSAENLPKSREVGEVILARTSELVQTKPMVSGGLSMAPAIQRLKSGLSRLEKKNKTDVIQEAVRTQSSVPVVQDLSSAGEAADVEAPLEMDVPEARSDAQVMVTETFAQEAVDEAVDVWTEEPERFHEPEPLLETPRGEETDTQPGLAKQTEIASSDPNITPPPLAEKAVDEAVQVGTKEPTQFQETVRVDEQELDTDESASATVAAQDFTLIEEIVNQAKFALASERLIFLDVIHDIQVKGQLEENTAKRVKEIDNSAVDQLLSVLAGHPHEATRLRSLNALAERQSTQFLSVFERAVDDPNARVRVAAISGLYKLKSAEAVPYLTKALSDKNATVRHRAAVCLAWIGTPDILPCLLALLSDPDASVRRAVVAELGSLKDAISIPRLIDALDDKDDRVSDAAFRALNELTGANIDFTPRDSAEERSRATARWKTWWKDKTAESKIQDRFTR